MSSPHPIGAPASAPTWNRWLVAAAAAVLFLLLGGVGGYLLAARDTPGPNSPEAGFARDMQTHHAQAVDMSLTIRGKSTDPTLDAVAYDIATTQQQQIGQMYAWLQSWGLPQSSPDRPMAWMRTNDTAAMGGDPGASMGHGNAAMQPLPDGRMPGMASDADLQRLHKADGKRAEVLYLRLMIAHHRAGIAMAKAGVRLCEQPQVVDLARKIVTSQRSEITALQRLLRERTTT